MLGWLQKLFGDREVLVSRHPVAQLRGNRLEVARATELLGAEAFGHLAYELRDISLLGCPDEDSRRAERLQLGRRRTTAFRVPFDPRHAPTLRPLDLKLSERVLPGRSTAAKDEKRRLPMSRAVVLRETRRRRRGTSQPLR